MAVEGGLLLKLVAWRKRMIDEQELKKLLADLESFRVERTISTTDTDKFREAICSFSNDMPGGGQPGFLLVGADDKTGKPSGLKVTDDLLRQLNSYARDGVILPPPSLAVYKIALSSGDGDVAVTEVQPSDMPPVRYKGRIHVRTGPQKGIANESQERILLERRRAAAKSFDAQPCLGSSLNDLALDLFTTSYRSQAIAPEIIAENHRPLEQQMASLRLFDLAKNCPTQQAFFFSPKTLSSGFRGHMSNTFDFLGAASATIQSVRSVSPETF